jgi:hypothetical protein
MFDQNEAKFGAPGNRQDIPTMAILFVFELLDF